MSDSKRYDGFSDEQLKELHDASERFEQRLKTGEKPKIESDLESASSAIRTALFTELLEVEIEFRIAAGQQPTSEEYLTRFPDRDSFINQVFADVDRTSAEQETRVVGERGLSKNGGMDRDLAQTKDRVRIAPGVNIGHYKLLQPIGEGGMGSVWMAEQSKPVRRNVALKIIKAGMDTREVIARFESERQALAMMDHPNIAKVLDAGETNQGRPFFVMELVKGIPITKYCDTKHLESKQRLRLFSAVCRAVQHAHQKGIIHRDIKPSNVLVTEQDGEPVVKVIDFGLAKATGQSLTDKTMFTAIGQMVGTPVYMSPEQADSGLDIDTRTDVYALGVLLYELLTGYTPIDPQKLRSAGFAEIQRIIREVDPPSMSHRVSKTTLDSQANAKNRATDSKRLTLLLRGDLDLIVKKSLEKDRNRRYDSPSNFAADVQRFLDSEPVLASPPSARYKFQKFLRRNRASVAAASLVAGALVLGLIGTTYGLYRADQARRDADDRADGEATAKLDAQLAAEQERIAKVKAREAVNRYLTRVSESKLLNVPGMQPLRKELLQDALEYFEGFLEGQDNSPDALRDVASAQFKVGEITRLIGSQETALASFLSSKKTSLSIPLELREVPKDPLNILNTLQKISKIQIELGRIDEAAKTIEECTELGQELANAHSDNQAVQYGLSRALQSEGLLFMNTGRNVEARARLERAISIVEKLKTKTGEMALSDSDADNFQRYLAGYVGDLAIAMSSAGLYSESIKNSERSIKLLRELSERPNATMADHDELARRTQNISIAFQRVGRMNDAESSLIKCCETYENLIEANPTMTDFRVSLAFATSNLGINNGRQGRHDKALNYFQSAKKIFEQAALVKPKNAEIRLGIARMVNNISKEQEFAGEMDKAIASCKEAIAVYRELAEEDPENVEIQINLGIGLQNLALNLCKSDRQEEALPVFNEAQSVREERVEITPKNAFRKSELASVLHAKGTALSQLDRAEEAVSLYRESIVQEQNAISIQTEGTPFLMRMSYHYDSLIATLLELKQFDAALLECDKLRQLESAVPDHLYNAACVYCLAASEIKSAKSELSEDDLATVKGRIEAALDTLEEAIAGGWNDLEHMESDTDLNILRDTEQFKELSKPKGGEPECLIR